VITGHEIVQGLVEDRFAPLLEAKLAALGSEVREVVAAPDDTRVIGAHLRRLAAEGADLILTTGGLSVDPDDVTRQAIVSAGGEVLVYGAPVLPGAMFLVARLGAVPVLGIPACGVHHAVTVLDLLLPRVLAGETLTRSALARMGHGGLCLDCPECRFPICPFGR
jgi:molybdopterin biosynthesis enzyme